MPGRFRDLTDLRIAYSTSDRPIHTFYVPVLSRAKRLDRSVGYFTARGLTLYARGLSGFVANGGRMRMLVGAQLLKEDVRAIESGADLADITRRRLLQLFGAPQNEVQVRRLEILAWMVAIGTLQIKVGLPRDPRTGLPLAAPESDGYFHVKSGVATDERGDRIGWSGSNNETVAAHMSNYEEFMVHRSWAGGQAYTDWLEDRFRQLWEDRHDDWITVPIPDAVQQRLLEYTPAEAPTTEPVEEPGEQLNTEAVIAAWLRDAPHLLGVGKRLGRATAAIQPWPHQYRVADDIVASFPDRFLLADEVGLGKTIEVGLALRDLTLSGMVERCLILAPKSVLQQWHDELREKFLLRAADYAGTESLGAEPLLLVSSQLAKRKERREEFLDGPDWDLVVVDEAHHARRKGFRDPNRRPNRLLELLEGFDGKPGLAAKTRGLLLLTATPMQVHPLEVWDLLIQLDPPGRWGASGAYFLRYFEALRKANDDWEAADWGLVAAMARDERDHGGEVYPEVAEPLKKQLGWASWDKLSSLVGARSADQAIRTIKGRQERAALLAMLRHLTPLRRRMRRFTRRTLRDYQKKGLLPGRLAERQPEPRWVEMAPDERELYDRVEEYISEFYKKYEGERKGLGFVMTVYRRRLTSSFYALERSLARRLEFLRSQGAGVWLTDEDVEEDDLQLDIEEVLEVEDHPLRSFYADEVNYVEKFLGDLRNLGSDTKFGRLVDDLHEAFSRRDSVVIFTQYTDTMDYLRDRLRYVYGRGVACYSGRGGERWDGRGWEEVGKERIKQDFAAGEIAILLGTDAMAEGLNLQTCGVEINYDVPWNPMRLEQRIGRVDRIGQIFDTVWIWSYFLEGTIEAEVYKRLMARIDWFTGVVGPLQPILHQVSQTVQELALMPRAAREAQLDERVGKIEAEIDQAEKDGLDFDDHLVPPHLLDDQPPPVKAAELEEFFVGSATLARRFRPDGDIEGAFLLDGERVTFRPDIGDQHPETLRLLTFGDRLFSDILDEFAQPGVPRFGITRVETVGLLPPRVAWYRDTEDGLTTIDTLESLRKALESNVQNPDIPTDATGTFLSTLEKEQAGDKQTDQRRREERASALREKGRRILARAAYIWLARRSTLFEEQQPPMTSNTAKSMIETEGYPFAPLATLVGVDIHLSITDPDWQKVAGKTRASQDGIMQTLRNQASQLLGPLTTKPDQDGTTVGIESQAKLL